MNVLFLSAWYPTPRDQMAGLFVQKHADAVRAQGADVRVVYTEAKGLRYWHEMFRGLRALKREGWRPNVVQVNVLDKNGLLALWLWKRYRIPYIIVEHWSGYLPANFSFRGGWHGWLMRHIAKQAQCILPVSQMLEDAMKKCGIQNARWERIHNVVDDFFYRQSTDGRTTVERTVNERSTNDEPLVKEVLTLRGCTGNNLKNVTVSIPLGMMVGVTGVSGSGKSTLINQTLYPILSQHFYRSLQQPLPYEAIEGLEYIDKVIAVDQSPIGRTPRSNPATYTNVFNDIRELFAQLPEARIRAWKSGRFSFNAKGGRCEECAGNGYKTLQMHFLPDVYVPCEVCGGQRYNRETLEVKFKGKSISDVLDMTVNQAVEFFEAQPTILKKIKTIQEVGLGYIKLGQASTSLSGGESQRIKLATELSRPSTGRTLYILDEPTTGLHFEDIRILLAVLRKLVDKGNTVLIIEHNPDVIRACDYLIDLGPEGGREGGQIVAVGTPDELRHNPKSLTGKYL